ncbi:MAG: GNAT family protein [Bacteroidales bacterium]|jgi:diamine N-acetyltransferase|nr:GNAT family protein [Bacteroidales bacterium]
MMKLRSSEIQLRAPEPSDVDLLYRWENDESLWHVSNTLAPFSRFTLEQYILNNPADIFAHRQLRLMIDLVSGTKATRKTIGTVDLFEFEPVHHRAGIGILIIPEYQRKTYATQALKLMLKYSFEHLQLHQLFCNISTDNEASMRLFQKLGFQINGRKREWLMINDQWADEIFLQLLKSD